MHTVRFCAVPDKRWPCVATSVVVLLFLRIDLNRSRRFSCHHSYGYIKLTGWNLTVCRHLQSEPLKISVFTSLSWHWKKKRKPCSSVCFHTVCTQEYSCCTVCQRESTRGCVWIINQGYSGEAVRVCTFHLPHTLLLISHEAPPIWGSIRKNNALPLQVWTWTLCWSLWRKTRKEGMTWPTVWIRSLSFVEFNFCHD